jgi:nucleoside-diphosphate-sugar epimerase
VTSVLVTGGFGFIGSHLARQLIDRGLHVRILDNASRGERGRIARVAEDSEVVEADIRDAGTVREAVRGCDIVYHLAAVNGTKNFYERPEEVLDINLEGTRNVVEAAREEGIDRLVFPSSSEVYGFPGEFPTPETHPLQIMDSQNPRYSYAGTKILGEQIVINAARNASFDFTILRPHNIYGPDMGYDHVIPEFIERIVGDEEFTIYGDGKQTRCFCYVSDAVDAFQAAGEHSQARNSIYNVGTEDEVTINELAAALFEVAGVSPDIEHIESKELSGSPRRRHPDVSKAKRELGYSPKVSLEDGLSRTFDAYCRDLVGVGGEEWRSS